MKARYCLLIWLALGACNTPEDLLTGLPEPPTPASGRFERGVFVLNEGNFDWGYGSVSFLPTDSVAEGADPQPFVRQEIFRQVNGFELGNVVQSLSFHDGRGYVVVNNSEKVEVMDAATFETLGTIRGVNSPRYLLPVGQDRAYVTELYADKIYVVSLRTLQVETEILVSGWTEQLVRLGNRVFVTNRRTAFDSRPGGHNLLVIDPIAHRITDSLALPFGPRDLVLDRHNRLWVLCRDDLAQRPAALVRIDPATLTVEQTFTFEAFADPQPSHLALSPTLDTLLFVSGDVFRHPVASPVLTATPFVRTGRRLVTGLGVDPRSGQLYLADAVDYVQPGWVLRYRPDGLPLDSFRVGVIPTKFVFR